MYVGVVGKATLASISTKDDRVTGMNYKNSIASDEEEKEIGVCCQVFRQTRYYCSSCERPESKLCCMTRTRLAPPSHT